jgi:hypothetical protein
MTRWEKIEDQIWATLAGLAMLFGLAQLARCQPAPSPCTPPYVLTNGQCVKVTYSEGGFIPQPTTRTYVDVDGAVCVETLNLLPSSTTCTKPAAMQPTATSTTGVLPVATPQGCFASTTDPNYKCPPAIPQLTGDAAPVAQPAPSPALPICIGGTLPTNYPCTIGGFIFTAPPVIPIPPPSPAPVVVVPSPAMRLTISQQTSPYTLSKGMLLYSAQICTDPSETRTRTFAAGRIRQAFEDAGGSFVDSALFPPMITAYVSRSIKGRLLGVVSYVSTGGSVASAAVTAYKAAQPNIGNARTWADVATVLGALGAGIPIAQQMLRSDVANQQATITTGVRGALITDMTAIFSVPAGGGCYRSIMFLGSGITSAKAVLQ